ncbi:CPBP family intramembrane glutamic endopeptidase [Haloimpatiens sp. FM7315]|uniref:CPBP family intramembrane glutamic endopeptidase n=1 Tax=Haloimpatiens sp. FM7315 TaxID=3298609 RepID=UPI00370AAD20
MDNFFQSIKIRKIILLYFLITIITAGISELPVLKKCAVLDFQFWLMITNAVLFICFIFKLKKSNIKINTFINDFRDKINYMEILKLIIVNIVLSLGFILCLCFIIHSINPQRVDKLLNEDSAGDINSVYLFVVNFIGGTLLAPFVEEFIVRGVILNRLKIRWKVKTSILVSSFLFGIMHTDIAFLGAFVFGIFMSIIYLKTRNILINIFAHALNNFIISITQIYFLFDTSSSSINNFNYNIMGSAGLILLLIAGIFAMKYINKNKKFCY